MANPYQEVFGRIGVQRAYNPPISLELQHLGHAGLYFGLAGEDAALRTLLKTRLLSGQRGTYVDIGCNYPVCISNTYLFYCYGWRGLCLDADADLTAEWRAVRPGDAFVATAVGETPGRAFLVKHGTNAGMHILQGDDSPRGAEFLPPRGVSVQRLDALLDRHIGDKPIDLMSIDVEGAEYSVLASNDWNRWRPSVIIMECHDLDFERPYAAPTVAFLKDRGYRLVAMLGGNVVMKPA